MGLRLRRGGITGEPPPLTETYGPLLGAQTIRDNVGPRTVSDPGGGVTFTASSNIQTLIDGNPYNTLFVASASAGSTFNNFRNRVYSARHPRFYFPGAPNTFVIDGGSVDGWGLNGTGTGANGGLEVYGGTWKNYGLPTGTTVGGVTPIVIGGGGGASIIQDAIFTLNNQIGVAIYLNVASSGALTTMLFSHCTFSNNGRYGFSGSSLASANSSAWFYTPTVEWCLFDNNNVRNFDTGDDAGGQKFSYTDGGNFGTSVYKNTHGHAMWFDGYNRNATLHDGVIEDNQGIGLFWEIGRGNTIIEHMYATRNGNAADINYPFNATQFVISCSPSDASAASFPGPNTRSQIRNCDIDASGYSTPIVLYTHGDHPDTERTRNWYVNHNRMWLRGATAQQRVGLCDACTPGHPHSAAKVGDIGTSPGLPALNLFDFNEYHVADISAGAAYWNHDTGFMSPGAMTWAQFKARGHEANSPSPVVI